MVRQIDQQSDRADRPDRADRSDSLHKWDRYPLCGGFTESWVEKY